MFLSQMWSKCCRFSPPRSSSDIVNTHPPAIHGTFDPLSLVVGHAPLGPGPWQLQLLGDRRLGPGPGRVQPTSAWLHRGSNVEPRARNFGISTQASLAHLTEEQRLALDINGSSLALLLSRRMPALHPHVLASLILMLSWASWWPG